MSLVKKKRTGMCVSVCTVYVLRRQCEAVCHRVRRKKHVLRMRRWSAVMLPLSEDLPLSSAARHAKIITPSNSDGPAST